MKSNRKTNHLLQALFVATTALIALQAIVAPVNAALPSKTLKIGIGLPTTGGLGFIGADEIRGAKLAIAQANAILAAGTTGFQFTTAGAECDTGTDAATANSCYLLLVDTDHVAVIVGPAGSGEATGLKASADTRGVPVISPSSTSPKLHLNDSIIRVVGPDNYQGAGIATWLYHQGIRHVAAITRNDPYGTGIIQVMAQTFLLFPGTEVADGACLSSTPASCATTYDPTSSALPGSADTAEAALESQVTTLAGAGHANGNYTAVGVVSIAFENDGNEIFTKASTNPADVLRKVRWFGSDGELDNFFLPSTQSGGGVSAQVASFLLNVSFTGTNGIPPLPGPLESNMQTLFVNGSAVNKAGTSTMLVNLTGTGYTPTYSAAPQVYDYYAYDAAWLAILTVFRANSYNGLPILHNMPYVANVTMGATGIPKLDAMGDRALQDYVLWSYKKPASNYLFDTTTGPFYASAPHLIVGTQPSQPEGGSTVWTDSLQTLSEAATVSSVITFANAYVALSLLLFASTAIMIVSRRRRL